MTIKETQCEIILTQHVGNICTALAGWLVWGVEILLFMDDIERMLFKSPTPEVLTLSEIWVIFLWEDQ